MCVSGSLSVSKRGSRYRTETTRAAAGLGREKRLPAADEKRMEKQKSSRTSSLCAWKYCIRRFNFPTLREILSPGLHLYIKMPKKVEGGMSLSVCWLLFLYSLRLLYREKASSFIQNLSRCFLLCEYYLRAHLVCGSVQTRSLLLISRRKVTHAGKASANCRAARLQKDE